MAPTAALVTDIGNDLMYGASVEEILDWVHLVLTQLNQIQAKVVVSLLPMGSITTLSPARYKILRRLLFPGCRLELDVALQPARALNDQLKKLCENLGCCSVEHHPDWYGYDPIHIKRRHWVQVWTTFMAPWVESRPAVRVPKTSFRRRIYLWSLVPERRWIFGFKQERWQPAGKLPDGSLISLH